MIGLMMLAPAKVDMNEGGYRGGSTVGGKWGCGLAALVGAPLLAVLTLVDALGDRAPDMDCHKGFLRHVALPTIVVVLIVGLGVRYLVNRVWGDGR